MVTPFHLFMFYKKLSEKLKKQRGACSAIQIYSAGGGQHFSRHFDTRDSLPLSSVQQSTRHLGLSHQTM
jgi:hypothetical protein